MELISKNLKYQASMKKLFEMISMTTDKGDKEIKDSQKNKKKSDDQSLEKRVEASLEKLEATLSLPKISINDHKTTKSVFSSSKFS